MYAVAMIGAIASGKSTIAQMFHAQGITIVSADLIARALTTQGEVCYAAIVDHFGPQVVGQQQTINRSKLREIIFRQPAERAWLEGLLHPAIREAIAQQIQQSTSTYVIAEIPLLLQRSDYPFIDRILMVETTTEQQLSRLLARDTCTPASAQRILAAQPSIQQQRSIADDHIVNDTNLERLQTRILTLHQQYVSLAQTKCATHC